MVKRNGSIEYVTINPLQNISGAAFDMELKISDAIRITRTAQEAIWNDAIEGDVIAAVLGLVLYRLEKIQEDHAVIVKNAPFEKYVPGYGPADKA